MFRHWYRSLRSLHQWKSQLINRQRHQSVMTIDTCVTTVNEIITSFDRGGIELTLYPSKGGDHRIPRECDLLIYRHEGYVEIMPRNPNHYLSLSFPFSDIPAKITRNDQEAGKYEITVPNCTDRFDIYNKTQKRTEQPVGENHGLYSTLKRYVREFCSTFASLRK